MWSQQRLFLTYLKTNHQMRKCYKFPILHIFVLITHFFLHKCRTNVFGNGKFNIFFSHSPESAEYYTGYRRAQIQSVVVDVEMVIEHHNFPKPKKYIKDYLQLHTDYIRLPALILAWYWKFRGYPRFISLSFLESLPNSSISSLVHCKSSDRKKEIARRKSLCYFEYALSFRHICGLDCIGCILCFC